jgi:hypothetical protein
MPYFKNLPWFKTMIQGQIIGILVYSFASVLALYFPYVALSLTFGMWVFWAIITQDTDDDLEY